MLRPLTVTVHQCTCGYASIYKQKATRHAATCLAGGQRGRVTALDRVIPADSAAPARHRIACGSPEEERVWNDVVRDVLALPPDAAMRSADRAVVMLFREFRARAANVHVRGSSVVEYRGNSQTTVPLRKYCVWAAHDIAQRVAMLNENANDEAASRLKNLFVTLIHVDDVGAGNDRTWERVLRDKHDKRAVNLREEARDSLSDLYNDMETILKNL